MSDNIKVIFTGGTIGSLAEGNNISPDKSAKYMLIKKYAEKTNANIDRFNTTDPIYILSENAVLEDVVKMAHQIVMAQEENVKGIIMTHGSDTLAYSGAYLGLLLPKLKVPVVLVASNLILTDKNANGVENFITAVNLIDSGVKPNVYVAYKNPEDSFTSVYLGTRMAEPLPYSDSFYAPIGKRFAKRENGKIIFENTIVESSNKNFKLSGNFNKKCLYITPYTGLNYDVYKNVNFDYVLHGLYHSGTANTREGEDNAKNNLLGFADYCKQHNKPLYLCNIKKKDINYDSTNQMKEKNIKFIYDVLPNVALAKLNIAYNLIKKEERDEYLQTNINGECLQTNFKTNEEFDGKEF